MNYIDDKYLNLGPMSCSAIITVVLSRFCLRLLDHIHIIDQPLGKHGDYSWMDQHLWQHILYSDAQQWLSIHTEQDRGADKPLLSTAGNTQVK